MVLAPTRSFPVYNIDGAIAYPEFAYPVSSLSGLRYIKLTCGLAKKEHHSYLAGGVACLYRTFHFLCSIPNQT